MVVEIDGSLGEGGGQIIRTALTLSAITGENIKIINIRANRTNPGLRPQHLAAAKLTRKICRGELYAELGSEILTFKPGKIIGGKYKYNIGTAGSIILVAQTVIPILLTASKKSSLELIGGTDVLNAPTYDYFEKVFLETLRLSNVEIKSELKRTGYYPKGNGKMKLEIVPIKDFSHPQFYKTNTIKAIIRIANLPESIAIREKKIFWDQDIYDVKIIKSDADSPGNSITCWKGTIGSAILGQKGKRAEYVAEECLENLQQEKGDVDRHLADQLMIYGALTEEKIEYTTDISMHTKTNAEIMKLFGYSVKINGSRIKIN